MHKQLFIETKPITDKKWRIRPEWIVDLVNIDWPPTPNLSFGSHGTFINDYITQLIDLWKSHHDQSSQFFLL